jgi:C4-dicarboxylate transporter DctM subunit
MSAWVVLALPAALLLLGLPIFAVLLISALAAVALFTTMPLTMAPQVFFGAIDQYTLIAIPLFIFAGELMVQGGASRRIIRLALALFGALRGSLGLTTVGACEIFGTMSGSSQATVAAVGRQVYPDLLAKGYGERFSLGLITSCGAIAIVIPPSVPMILYGAVGQQSISDLFAGGVIPGLLMGLATALYVVWHAKRNGIRETARFDRAEFAAALKDGIPALGTPVVILGGIYAGVFSPTEAAGVASVYTIAVSRFVYREGSWAQVWRASTSTMYVTAQVMVVVAAAGVYSWVLTISGFPQQVVELIRGLDVSAGVVLLLVNVVFLVAGCFIDPASAILILTPLLLPVLTSIGVDPVHFGVVMAVNLAIGMYTPPFGLNIFMSQVIFKASVSQIYRGIVPFVCLQLAVLALVTYVPSLSLYLPRMLR